jgi:Methyltransferase domain
MSRQTITPDSLPDMDASKRRREWHLYYSEKRIGHQWMQIDLLSGLDVARVLEVGPYLGLVTAMLDNAGYDVTTLDLFAPPFTKPERPNIEADLLSLKPERIAGFDAILCCETLEHLPWESSPGILRTFHDSGARYLVLSVPYEGFQFGWSIYLNPFTWRQYLSLKKLNRFRTFRPDPDPWGHKWELGFKDYDLKRWEAVIADAGWTIRRREFSHPCRSVFHLCERAA